MINFFTKCDTIDRRLFWRCARLRIGIGSDSRSFQILVNDRQSLLSQWDSLIRNWFSWHYWNLIRNESGAFRYDSYTNATISWSSQNFFLRSQPSLLLLLIKRSKKGNSLVNPTMSAAINHIFWIRIIGIAQLKSVGGRPWNTSSTWCSSSLGWFKLLGSTAGGIVCSTTTTSRTSSSRSTTSSYRIVAVILLLVQQVVPPSRSTRRPTIERGIRS